MAAAVGLNDGIDIGPGPRSAGGVVVIDHHGVVVIIVVVVIVVIVVIRRVVVVIRGVVVVIRGVVVVIRGVVVVIRGVVVVARRVVVVARRVVVVARRVVVVASRIVIITQLAIITVAIAVSEIPGEVVGARMDARIEGGAVFGVWSAIPIQIGRLQTGAGASQPKQQSEARNKELERTSRRHEGSVKEEYCAKRVGGSTALSNYL